VTALTDDLVLALVNAPAGDAARIARAIVELELAACVNVVPAVKSFYRWEGRLVEDVEATLFIKTRRALVPRLTEEVKAIHPYSVPEVIALALDGELGNADYLAWVRAETAKTPLEVSEPSARSAAAAPAEQASEHASSADEEPGIDLASIPEAVAPAHDDA
jgi:periplasmic divalent cation tolerance protein